MPGRKSSPEWSKKTVLKKLREEAGSDPVHAQVFLEQTAGDLQQEIVDLVQKAKKKAGSRSEAAVGKVHRLANSFSITAAPDVLEALAAEPSVKSVLPSEIADVYPKPV